MPRLQYARFYIYVLNVSMQSSFHELSRPPGRFNFREWTWSSLCSQCFFFDRLSATRSVLYIGSGADIMEADEISDALRHACRVAEVLGEHVKKRLTTWMCSVQVCGQHRMFVSYREDTIPSLFKNARAFTTVCDHWRHSSIFTRRSRCLGVWMPGPDVVVQSFRFSQFCDTSIDES